MTRTDRKSLTLKEAIYLLPSPAQMQESIDLRHALQIKVGDAIIKYAPRVLGHLTTYIGILDRRCQEDASWLIYLSSNSDEELINRVQQLKDFVADQDYLDTDEEHRAVIV